MLLGLEYRTILKAIEQGIDEIWNMDGVDKLLYFAGYRALETILETKQEWVLYKSWGSSCGAFYHEVIPYKKKPSTNFEHNIYAIKTQSVLDRLTKYIQNYREDL